MWSNKKQAIEEKSLLQSSSKLIDRSFLIRQVLPLKILSEKQRKNYQNPTSEEHEEV